MPLSLVQPPLLIPSPQPKCSSASPSGSKRLPNRSLGDTLQLLAFYRPLALKLIEKLAAAMAEPVLKSLDKVG